MEILYHRQCVKSICLKDIILACICHKDRIGFINEDGIQVIPPKFFYKHGSDKYVHYPQFYEGLVAVLDECGKFGYMNTLGDVVIPFKFDMTYRFCEGVSSVKQGDKWGFINELGKVVIPCLFDNATNFSGGYCPVYLDEKWGQINKNGDIIVPCEYDDVFYFLNGVSCAKKDGKWLIIHL